MNLFEKNPTPLRAFREAEEKSARKKARAARWRRSWLRRAAGWLRDILQRPDRAQAGRPGGTGLDPTGRRCSGCGCGLPVGPSERCSTCPPEGPASVWEALTQAQVIARRAGHRELADALHAVFLLDLTGNLADMAPLVASVRAGLQSALGDDPGAVN